MATKNFNKRVVSIKPSSVAMLQGTFMSIIGLGVAVLFSLNKTVDVAESTNSVLAGLTLGITAGALAIVVVPLVYFAFGWVIGYLQGFVLNFVVEAAGGLEVKLEENDKK